MCRYNMSFNDAVMNELRPHFKDEEWTISCVNTSLGLKDLILMESSCLEN